MIRVPWRRLRRRPEMVVHGRVAVLNGPATVTLKDGGTITVEGTLTTTTLTAAGHGIRFRLPAEEPAPELA